MKELFGGMGARLKAWGAERWLALGVALLSALIVIQIVRYGAARVGAWSLTRALKNVAESAPKREEVELAAYDPVLSKGLLGEASPEGGEQKANVFGVLGNKALIGMSPGDAQPYELDAEVPGGEKLVEISVDEVVLEKDGEKRTVKVFSGTPVGPPPNGPPGGPPQGGPPPGDAPPGGAPPGDAPPGDAPPGGAPPGDAPPGARPADGAGPNGATPAGGEPGRPNEPPKPE